MICFSRLFVKFEYYLCGVVHSPLMLQFCRGTTTLVMMSALQPLLQGRGQRRKTLMRIMRQRRCALPCTDYELGPSHEDAPYNSFIVTKLRIVNFCTASHFLWSFDESSGEICHRVLGAEPVMSGSERKLSRNAGGGANVLAS